MPTSSRVTRSHAAKLPAMRRRILDAYAQASADDLASGIAWYDRARTAAAALLPHDPERAAGVIAALSPRCRWNTNLAWAAALIEAAERGDSEPPAVHTQVMRGQAWRIAQGEPALSVLNGPKVRAFYSNIVGDLDAVTVDVWAAAIAEGTLRIDRRKGTVGSTGAAPSGHRYSYIARAYREAAAMVGMHPRDMQAAVWVAVRGAAD